MRMKVSTYCLSLTVALVGIIAAVAGCNHNSRVGAITIIPGAPDMVKGSTLQLSATATFSDGNAIPWTLLTWSSSNPSVATIVSDTTSSVNGMATAVDYGQTIITATDNANGISSSITLSVTPPIADSFKIYPPNPSMALNTTHQFFAQVTFADGFTQDLTQSVSWRTANATLAWISSADLPNTTAPYGILTTNPTTTGTTEILASMPAEPALSQATMTLTITGTSLQSITVSPITTLALPAVQQFTAIGNYADGSMRDLTDSVTWSSSNKSIITISNTEGSQGLATTIAVGTVAVTATDPITNVGGSASVTVTSP